MTMQTDADLERAASGPLVSRTLGVARTREAEFKAARKGRRTVKRQAVTRTLPTPAETRIARKAVKSQGRVHLLDAADALEAIRLDSLADAVGRWAYLTYTVGRVGMSPTERAERRELTKRLVAADAFRKR